MTDDFIILDWNDVVFAKLSYLPEAPNKKGFSHASVYYDAELNGDKKPLVIRSPPIDCPFGVSSWPDGGCSLQAVLEDEESFTEWTKNFNESILSLSKKLPKLLGIQAPAGQTFLKRGLWQPAVKEGFPGHMNLDVPSKKGKDGQPVILPQFLFNERGDHVKIDPPIKQKFRGQLCFQIYDIQASKEGIVSVNCRLHAALIESYEVTQHRAVGKVFSGNLF